MGAPGGYPPPGSYPPQPYGYAPAAALPFRRNASLILAQVLAIIQSSLGMLLGIGILLLGIFGASRLQDYINQHPDQFNNTTVNFGSGVLGFVIGVGVVIFIIFALLTFLAIRAGRPSQAARWILAVVEVLFLLGSLRGLGAGGNATISSIVSIVWEGLIVIGLIIDPNTYRAYARRNLPATTAARGV